LFFPEAETSFPLRALTRILSDCAGVAMGGKRHGDASLWRSTV